MKIKKITKIRNKISHNHGHVVKWRKKNREDEHETPFYLDGEEVWDNPRPCPLCHRLPSPEGHDACIANLPGVLFACCGHGIEEGYIYYEGGRTLRFENMYRDDEVEG